MHALYQDILHPSGVEFATCLNLTTPGNGSLSTPPNATLRHEVAARTLCNIAVARSNILRIFQVREEPAPISAQAEDERERRSRVRQGTEAVEGEAAMDQSGEGFVNIAKFVGQKSSAHISTVTRLYFVREHVLHATVTGLQKLRTLASLEDNLDRLLVSFKDAKIALLEWSDAVHDLVTVSIHTYERAPQLMALDSALFRTELRVDPGSRCAALSLPKDALAILPIYQEQVDLDAMDQDQTRDVPYAPSFILDLPVQLDGNIRNVIDFTFLPGLSNPTVALLYQTEQTWTGRLEEHKDTTKLVIFTLNVVTQSHPIITSVEGLPHDSFAIVACPYSIGGMIVMSSNAIIFVDQTSRKVALAVNGWASRMSDLSFLPPDPKDATRNLELEGSRSVFVDDKTIFIILRDGTIYPVEIGYEGKTVSKLTLAQPLAQTTIPTVVTTLSNDHIFIGSTVGPSILLKAAHVEEEVNEELADTSLAAVVQPNEDMDLYDDDDDIYGPSSGTNEKTNGAQSDGKSGSKKMRTVIQLSLSDSLPAYGPIADMVFSLAKNGDRSVPELVAATGSGHLGGFTMFQRDLPIRTKRKLHAIGGARGMWSLNIRQPIKANGIQYERAMNPFHPGNDTLIISTDVNPSPGLSRISTRSSRGDISITARIPGTTIGAAPFFQRTAILHVMTNAIRVLEPDGAERQIIKDQDGNMPRPKIRLCSICDPFVLIVREDDSIGLFIGEPERGKIRRKDMSPMGDKASRYLTGCFYTDESGLFHSQLDGSLPLQNQTSTLQAAVNAGNKSQWLLLVRPQGTMELWTLPKLSLAFSTTHIATLQNVLTDSFDSATLSLPQDPHRKLQDLDIEQIIIAPIGASDPRPHLCVFLRSGVLTVYEILPAGVPAERPPGATRTTTLKIKFVKVISRSYEIQRPEENDKSIIAEQKRFQRLLVPFTTTPKNQGGLTEPTYSGVFFTGDRPSWLLAGDKNKVQIYPSGHAFVHAFTPCSLWDSKGDFLLYSDEGPTLVEWVTDYSLGGPLPSRSVPRGRAYTNVIFDPSTALIIASSSLQARFASFDEDGNKIWEPDAPDISDPTTRCSSLELISPEKWNTMDGYEFATNEFINSMQMVTLETSSTEPGTKDYLAVGTTVDRGEDLAVKGATYIFEIVEVVPDPDLLPKRWYKLRLRCKDDAKGPVTAVCGFNGYIVSSMGQKIFVRAFDADERLVGVAFMDVGVYVTSLRTMKNLLLIGDAVKSVWFVAFQEDPYKLVLLGKDTQQVCVTNADFFFTDSELSIVTGDEDGIVRMYEYNPQDPESRDGRRLLLRTEFHRQCEYHASALIARRTKEDLQIPQSKLICGSADGSLFSLTAVDEQSFKRLQFLQGQLTRNIQHTAGLNPKAYRTVRSDFTSKPLSRGILDGSLLAFYEELPISKQTEMTKQIGTERTTVLHDWVALAGTW